MADENPRDTTPRAVQACHELLAWLIPQLDLFPRARRFTLGERLETGLLRVLEALVEAAYSREKRAALAMANRTLEVERHLWRLAYELRVIPFHRAPALPRSSGSHAPAWEQVQTLQRLQ